MPGGLHAQQSTPMARTPCFRPQHRLLFRRLGVLAPDGNGVHGLRGNGEGVTAHAFPSLPMCIPCSRQPPPPPPSPQASVAKLRDKKLCRSLSACQAARLLRPCLLTCTHAQSTLMMASHCSGQEGGRKGSLPSSKSSLPLPCQGSWLSWPGSGRATHVLASSVQALVTDRVWVICGIHWKPACNFRIHAVPPPPTSCHAQPFIPRVLLPFNTVHLGCCVCLETDGTAAL